MPEPASHALVDRLSGFAPFLRANGFAIGGGDAAQIVATAARVGVLDGEVLRWSLKALLCSRGDEWRRYDELFDAWFRPPNKQARFEPRVGRAPYSGGQPPTAIAERARDDGGDDEDLPTDVERSASRDERLSSADFRELAQREHLLDIEALMRRFARRLKHIVLRREAQHARGPRLDLRATIRRSVASGGTPLRLAWKDRRRVRPRLVLLLDVSRSMSAYSFFWLRLARALAGEIPGVHCCIFHTRVTAVTEALRDPDPWRSQERLHLMAGGWAGGTRIGESLACSTAITPRAS